MACEVDRTVIDFKLTSFDSEEDDNDEEEGVVDLADMDENMPLSVKELSKNGDMVSPPQNCKINSETISVNL